MQYSLLSKCFATGKTRYATPADAKQALLKLKSKNNTYDNVSLKRTKRRNGKPQQCRYYYCKDCRGFHLTSNAKVLKQKTIEKYHQQRVRNTEGLVVTKEEKLDWKKDSLPFPELKKTI